MSTTEEPMQKPNDVCKTNGCEERMVILYHKTAKKNLPVIVCPRCDENPQNPFLIAKATTA